MDFIQAFLAVLDATGSIGIAVLVWRAIVADKERSELLSILKENAAWLRALVMKTLTHTDIEGMGGN